jgi:copper chaperone CopZ
MVSDSCVNKIEANLQSLKGIEACTVSFTTAIASIEYIPSVIGPRDIIEKIEVNLI